MSCAQRVLDDSVQIRSALQGFGSVLKDMSLVCDTEQLQAQLLEADAQVAVVQESFTAPLSQLEHAAAVSVRNSSGLAVHTAALICHLPPACRKWTPSNVRSGRCRANWWRWRSCCRRRRLCPSTRRRESRWDTGGEEPDGSGRKPVPRIWFKKGF